MVGGRTRGNTIGSARLLAGRQLKESPRWSESPALFFDATSGDYWVLGADAARVLRQLITNPGDLGDAESATVDELISAGILEGVAPGSD